MGSTPLRITFVLPFLTMTGGIRVVFEYTRELERRGHCVRLVVPTVRPGVPWSGAGRARLLAWLNARWIDPPQRNLDWYGLAGSVHTVPELKGDAFPDGDVILATSWPTAGPVADAPARCGRKAYLLQHYEVFQPGLEEEVDATWRLPLERIVISSWLARLARERFGVPTWGPMKNGINLEQFHARGRTEHTPPVVGMLYELQPWKGVADGLEAVRLAREQVPALGLHMFGRYRLRHALRAGDRYERNPSQERLAAIYRECDLFLGPSWTEGWNLPPMEAMASGCAVVATEVGGIPDFATPGRDLLTAPPHEPRMLADHLVRLAQDLPARRSLARAGHDAVQPFTWPAATDALERCLVAIAAGAKAGA